MATYNYARDFVQYLFMNETNFTDDLICAHHVMMRGFNIYGLMFIIIFIELGNIIFIKYMISLNNITHTAVMSPPMDYTCAM